MMWCKNKVRYRDEVAAKWALAKLQMQDKPRPKGKVEKAAYACSRCRGWHLTSQER